MRRRLSRRFAEKELKLCNLGDAIPGRATFIDRRLAGGTRLQKIDFSWICVWRLGYVGHIGTSENRQPLEGD
jgi:hypothetical protein